MDRHDLPMTPSSMDDVSPATSSLERLVSPHSATEFISSYWEKAYLHAKGDRSPAAAGFSDLISVDDVDAFLSTICGAGPQRWDSIRLSQGGVPIPAESFQFNRQGDFANFDADRILARYRDGATLIVNSVQQTRRPIAVLCNDLAQFFGVRVLANVYITPPNGQGFPAHHDNHDVFLLQVLGAKRWRIERSTTASLSRWAERAAIAERPRNGCDEFVLRAGEVLYLPRGLVHEGFGSTETSIHLTIGVHPYTWAQLLIDTVGELQREEIDFRRSVAPQLGSIESLGDGLELEQTLDRLVGRLRDGRRLARVAVQRAAHERGPARLPVRGQFKRLVDPPHLELTTVVQPPPGADITVEALDDEATVTSQDKVVSFPGFVAPQLRCLFAGGPRCAANLPDGLDETGRMVLVGRLVREGLLEVRLPPEER